MVRKLFDNILRANGRIPESDLGEEEKKAVRRYIRLSGGSDDGNDEGLPDEYFEDSEIFVNFEDDKKAKKKQERLEKKDDLYQDLCFYSFAFIAFMVLVGFFVLIGRLIAYPFIKRAAKDLDF